LRCRSLGVRGSRTLQVCAVPFPVETIGTWEEVRAFIPWILIGGRPNKWGKGCTVASPGCGGAGGTSSLLRAGGLKFDGAGVSEVHCDFCGFEKPEFSQDCGGGMAPRVSTHEVSGGDGLSGSASGNNLGCLSLVIALKPSGRGDHYSKGVP